MITERGRVPLAGYLAENDIVVNCTLQDTEAPLTYLSDDDLDAVPAGQPDRRRVLRRGHGLRVGHGRPRSTTRCSPSATASHYYAVDHSPSYLWNSATWENSEALLPFLPVGDGGPGRAGTRTRPSRRAIEIRDGSVVNPAILQFQRRAAEAPYAVS